MSHDHFLYQHKMLTLSYLEFPSEPGFIQVLSQHVWRYDSEELHLKLPPYLPVGWPKEINIQQKQCYFAWLGIRTNISKSLKNAIKMR